MKAFSILGVFSTAAALVLTFTIRFEGSIACSIFAAFSYMIIWTINADNWLKDSSSNSDCGMGYGDRDGVQYGCAKAPASFPTTLPCSPCRPAFHDH